MESTEPPASGSAQPQDGKYGTPCLGAGAGEDAGVAAPLARGPKPGVIVKKTSAATPKKTPSPTQKILRNSEQFPRAPKDHPQLQKTVITHRKNLRNPKKIAKNHENMAKRAKNVLLAISSRGGYFYIFVAMVKS